MRELFACKSGLHFRVVCIRELFVYESCLEESCLHGRAVCMGEQYVILARLGGRALMRTSRRQAGCNASEPQTNANDREVCDREVCDREVCDRGVCDREVCDPHSSKALDKFKYTTCLTYHAIVIDFKSCGSLICIFLKSCCDFWCSLGLVCDFARITLKPHTRASYEPQKSSEITHEPQGWRGTSKI